METITAFSAKNLLYPNYACTTFDDRVETFLQMKRAVHDLTQSVGILYFESPCDVGQTTYLSLSETLHLYEVSKIIDKLEILCPIIILIYFISVIVKIYRRIQVLKLSNMLTFLAICFLMGLAIFYLIGIEQLYKLFHIWIFPPNHKWTFPYRTSIMITMFLAPKFFLFIGGALLGLASSVIITLKAFETAFLALMKKRNSRMT